jgi:hypothetical protein
MHTNGNPAQARTCKGVAHRLTTKAYATARCKATNKANHRAIGSLGVRRNFINLKSDDHTHAESQQSLTPKPQRGEAKLTARG